MPLAASGVTHQGRRSTNEDSWLVDATQGLLVVADGMGGHSAGEVASALAVSTIQQFLRESRSGPDQAVLASAVQAANARILTAAAADANHAGMGTTVVAVLLSGATAVYANVGDSRLYLWRNRRLSQLTRDDSWLSSALGATEALSAEALANHPMRHVLTKVVGLQPDLAPAVSVIDLEPGDCLLLCTDGVHGSIPDAALAEGLGDARPVAEVARELVDLALARGASDNATAIVARVE